jgi:hypothetical protein
VSLLASHGQDLFASSFNELFVFLARGQREPRGVREAIWAHSSAAMVMRGVVLTHFVYWSSPSWTSPPLQAGDVSGNESGEQGWVVGRDFPLLLHLLLDRKGNDSYFTSKRNTGSHMRNTFFHQRKRTRRRGVSGEKILKILLWH